VADDVTLNTMTGGSVVATDEITNRHFQKMKMTFGADGTATDVSASNPYPVTVISIAAGDNNIGNVDIVSSALPSGAATSALQTTGNTALSAIQTAVEIIDNAISGTEMQVDIVSMPSVAVNNFPAGFLAAQSGSWTVSITGSVAVTGTFWQATQPVSNAGTFATQVTSIAAGDNNIGNVDVVTLPALPAGTNNIGDVDVLTLPALPTGSNVIGAVTQSGTWNVGTVTTLTGITNALPAGTNAIGKLAANSGVDIGDVDVTSISAGSNLIGDVGLQGRTTGGLSIFRSIDLDETEEEVKGSAGTLYSIDAMNMTASVLYLKIYDNTAAGTTVGTTTPVLTYVLPTNGDTNGCGMVKNIPQGLAFATGITVAVTTGLADNNTGAPAANAAIVNLGYK
jgi:hypothetical protein